VFPLFPGSFSFNFFTARAFRDSFVLLLYQQGKSLFWISPDPNSLIGGRRTIPGRFFKGRRFDGKGGAAEFFQKEVLAERKNERRLER
jgi:hypothetical protein